MPTGPGPRGLIDEDSFFDYVSSGQTYNISGGPRTTAAINGTPQYAATTHSVSDILQGSLGQYNPEDELLYINKTLTDSLRNFVDTGHDVYGYSSFTQIEAGAGYGGGGGTSSTQGSGVGGILNESWVNSLPLVHENGATIWQGEGKASREMHLPTSADIQTDVSQHKQIDMPTDWKHPYNMDRVAGDGAGGNKPNIGADGYVWDWGGGENIIQSSKPQETIGNENPTSPGTTGAFGYLDPDSEQWYMAMAWPYSGSPERSFERAERPDVAAIAKGLKKSDYQGKRILVFNVDSKKGVVCTPGDWGSQPYWSNGTEATGGIEGFYFGLSPDTHHYFGTEHGANVKVRWMPDDTPLGPYAGTGAAQGSVDLGSSSGQGVSNTLAEMKYAGEKLVNHPNLDGADRFKDHLVNGSLPQIEDPGRFAPAYFAEVNRVYSMPSLLNYMWVLLEAGFTFYIDGSGYVHRSKITSSSLSNHARAGAFDIHKIGYNGPPVGYQDPTWRSINDKMWEYMATKPRDAKPTETASSFEHTYGGWFRVYKDGNPNHVHIGFDENRVGALIPALLPTTASQGPSDFR